MKNIKKMLLPMFLLAISFCLISCGNKSNDENETNMPEVTIETPAETTEVEENVESNEQEEANAEEQQSEETETTTSETEAVNSPVAE